MALLAKANGSVEERQKLQVTCRQCDKEYVGRELARSGSFIGLPFKKQLGSVLPSKTVSKAAATTLDKASHGVACSGANDITDGHHYRSLHHQGGIVSTDLTPTSNSDGSPIFKSSTYSMWNVQAILNELLPLLHWANLVMPHSSGMANHIRTRHFPFKLSWMKQRRQVLSIFTLLYASGMPSSILITDLTLCVGVLHLLLHGCTS